MDVFILWKVKFYQHPSSRIVYGPYCPICGLELDYIDWVNIQGVYQHYYKCSDCKKDYILPHSSQIIKSEAQKRVFAKILQQYTPINLDLPPTKLQTRSEDEKYFIGAYLTQKDGRRVAVVYVGEKKDKQSKHDYAQIFIDLDQKQLRYDITNKNPNDLLSAFAAEFEDGSTHRVEKNK